MQQGQALQWTAVAVSANGQKIVAAASPGFIHVSSDGGLTWTARESERHWISVICSADGMKIVAAANQGPMVFSEDGGVTWTGGETKNWLSLAGSSDSRKLVAAIGNGPVVVSSDGGRSWTPTTAESGTSPRVRSSSDGRILFLESYQRPLRVSTDGGATWGIRSPGSPISLPACSADGMRLLAVKDYALSTSVPTVPVITYQPAAHESGSNHDALGFQVEDSGAAGANLDTTPNRLTFNVSPVADAPEIAVRITGQYAPKQRPFTFQFGQDAFVDRDPGTVLSYSATLADGSSLPSWLSFNPGTRTFSGLPGSADGGVLEVRLTATDNGTPPLQASMIFPITVAGLPAGQDGTVVFDEETSFLFQPQHFGFVDPDDSPPDVFAGIFVDELPAGGALTLNGNPVTPGTFASFLPVPGNVWVRRYNNACGSLAASADGSVIYGVMRSNAVCISRDGGVTWTTRTSLADAGSGVYTGGLACSEDGTKAVIVLNGGRIFTSHNSGSTWIARDSVRRWSGVACSADGNRMVAVDSGTESWAMAGWVYTSTDAGVTWTPRDWPPGNVQSLWSGLACSADGLRLAALIPSGSAVNTGGLGISADGGVTWTAGPRGDWYEVDCSADGSRIVAAGVHRVSVSTDYGVTWKSPLNEPNSEWVSCSMSADGMVLAAAVRGGRVHVSVDGGQTWNPSGSSAEWPTVAVSGDGRKLFASDDLGILSSTPTVPSLVYTPPVNAAGNPYASLRFRSVDTGPSGVNADTVSRTLKLQISDINDAPVVGSPLADQAASPGMPFAWQILANAFSDPDAGTTLSFSVTLEGGHPLPAWLQFNPASRTVSGTPGPADAGVLIITITASDVGSPPLTARANLSLVVRNSAPLGTNGAVLLAEDTSYTFSAADFGFLDPDDTPPNRFSQVFLMTVPAVGTLSIDGIPLGAGESVSMLPDARMKWTAGSVAANWTGITAAGGGSTLIATTGGFDQSFKQIGQVHVSPDWGLTWTVYPSNRYWTSIAASADGLRLAATALEAGVFTSQDGGRTWTPRTTQYVVRFRSVASSADGSTLLALPEDTNALILSRNGGVTWQNPLAYPEYTFGSWGNAAVSPDGRILAAIGVTGLIISRDGGLTWTRHSGFPLYSTVAMSEDGMTLVVRTSGQPLRVSRNGGRDWFSATPARDWTHACVSADGGTIAAATAPGRIYVSTDAGQTWRAKESSRSWGFVACSGDGSMLAATENQKQLYTSLAAVPELRFNPAPNGFGTPYASFNYQVADDGIGDRYRAAVTNSMAIGVSPVNDPPVVAAAIPDRTATERVAFSYRIPAGVFTDADPGTVLALSASTVENTPLPGWLSFDPGTTTLQGTPGSPDTGFLSVKITATDTGVPALSASTVVRVMISNVEDPPAGSGSDITLDEDSRLEITPSHFGFTDPLDRVPGEFTRVKLNTLPAAGVLRIDGVPAAAGDFVRVAPAIGDAWTSRGGTQNWFTVAASADGRRLIAGVSGGRLYTSTDSGVTWTARATLQPWYATASSSDGIRLAAAALNGYLYTSADAGLTWTQRDQVRNWRSIASSADGLKLAACASGGQLYVSTDAGATWTARETIRNWYSVASSADGSRLAAVVQNGKIFTSADSGSTWIPRESDRNWRTVVSSADGTMLAAIVTNGLIYRSTDSGVTWQPSAFVGGWYSICSSADGLRLGAAVQNGQIYLSTNGGQSWTPRESNRNWRSMACSADGRLYAAAVPGSSLYMSRLLGPQSLSFQPEPDASGAPYSSFTFQVEDSGPAGANLDLSPESLRLHVTARNDLPTLDPITDRIVPPGGLEAQSVPLSGISAGGGEVQTLTISAVSSNPLVIPHPLVAYASPQSTGSLQFSQLPGSAGSAVITVTITDSGGEGTDTFSRTFRIFATPFSIWARDRGLPPDAAADGGIHLLRYAFGMDAPGAGFQPLQLDGATIVQPGMPIIRVTEGPTGRRYDALHARRRDSTLSFVLEFSSDLASWHAASAVPAVVAEDAKLEVVSVPFPEQLANGASPRFMRVRVSLP